MKVKVEFEGKKKFKAKVRNHEVITDLPESKGGDDSASTPSELFVVSIGTCAGLYVMRYLETAKLDATGLSIDLDWEFHKEEPRISRIDIAINVPNTKLGNRKKAVIAAAGKCVIHQTLHNAPEMNVNVLSAD